MFRLHEIIIPSVIFGAIALLYLYEIINGAYSGEFSSSPKFGAITFFKKMREGWVDSNRMSGQAAANTTRDYLRVVIFLAGNAILLASIMSGFALNVEPSNDREKLRLIKLAACVGLFVAIFILLVLCLRFALHFQ
jgi:hypothetical protein